MLVGMLICPNTSKLHCESCLFELGFKSIGYGKTFFTLNILNSARDEVKDLLLF